ncbi:MAG: hypothetical protein QW041_00775 [Candidatus Pacearchaeota archaeon]
MTYKSFDALCRAIKKVRIQGAESVALTGIKALRMKGANIKKLLSLRPTEPLLRNSILAAKKFGINYVLQHFNYARKEYIKNGTNLIKSNSIIFTHCHSSAVIRILKESKKQGKKFEVINTETRPLFQGRKTAKELAEAGIKVTTIADLAAADALEKGGSLKQANMVLIGCDAILSDGSIINKIGSGMFAEIAYNHKVPVYVVGNSWKFSPKKVILEMRSYKELWKKMPKHVKVKNPAFEKVDAKYIKAIISELGILKPKDFVKKVKKVYPWILSV